MKIKLLPTNKRLKQIIKEYGEIWKIIDKKHVQCFNDIGFKIKSLDNNHERWITENDFLKI